MPTATAPRANQREHILDVALQLMSERGSASMSMRQLAQACGVQVAAIYHYFPSKDELLRSVVEERRYSSRLGELPDLATDAPVEVRLRAVFDLFWQGALLEEPVLRLLLGEALRSQPVALPTGAALLEVFHSGVVGALEACVPELPDRDVIAQLMVAQVFSGFIRHIFDPGADVDALALAQADVLVHAVLRPGTP